MAVKDAQHSVRVSFVVFTDGAQQTSAKCTGRHLLRGPRGAFKEPARLVYLTTNGFNGIMSLCASLNLQISPLRICNVY